LEFIGSPVNVTKGTGFERRRRLRRREKALKENPKSVTSMKQGWKAAEDVNRQEGEKPWSRKVSGEANPSEPGFRSCKR
jgi:hypothetical protein